ncbi:diguanylate cyclase [Candidatus Venteria ishoeyi]|uniref:diguanylate cyclase domain-containing protein n=1 Tax=Candidatus Venteria ishoeyi TaxID=1899563 RepID=UPI0025A54C6D|nr:diguanylate cyclase [Candidatus Venteria ishoeyi]MDM8545025.1 diguanylate cyclase [Candidatus Venteria ishoeyi]
MRLNTALFDHMNDGVILTNKEGVIERANTAFLHKTGYTLKEVIGKKGRFFQSRPHNLDFYQKLWAQLRSEGYWQGIVDDRKKNGYLFKTYLKIFAIQSANNDKATHYLGIYTDVDLNSHDYEALLYHANNYDHLTQLPNTALFVEKITGIQALVQRYNTRFALLRIALHRFDAVHRLMDYALADEVLLQVVERLNKRLRSTDLMSRMADNEFIMALVDVKDFSSIEHVAGNILRWLQMPFMLQAHTVTISAHIGIAVYPDDHKDIKKLMGQTKLALTQAKMSAEGGYAFFNAPIAQSSDFQINDNTQL